MSTESDEATFAEARERFVCRHLDACLKVHELVSRAPDITNNDYPELRQARESEKSRAFLIGLLFPEIDSILTDLAELSETVEKP